MKSDAALPSPSSWESVLLVCKECRKRSNGPKGSKSKEVVQEARSASKGTRPRPRVVLTSCLGLCPKGATAIAIAGGGQPRIAAARSTGQVSEIVTALMNAEP